MSEYLNPRAVTYRQGVGYNLNDRETQLMSRIDSLQRQLDNAIRGYGYNDREYYRAPEPVAPVSYEVQDAPKAQEPDKPKPPVIMAVSGEAEARGYFPDRDGQLQIFIKKTASGDTETVYFKQFDLKSGLTDFEVYHNEKYFPTAIAEPEADTLIEPEPIADSGIAAFMPILTNAISSYDAKLDSIAAIVSELKDIIQGLKKVVENGIVTQENEGIDANGSGQGTARKPAAKSKRVGAPEADAEPGQSGS